MRTAAFAVVIFVLATGVASAASVQLWAIDAGDWGNEESYLIDTDPLTYNSVNYPTGGVDTAVGAAYDPSTSTLYLSGWGPNNHNWEEQNTIAIYTGGPGNATFVSSSDQGMGNPANGYNWLAGIEYLDGSLYAIGYKGYHQGNFLIRIDNPGTISQVVTQIGDDLGDTTTMGIPFAMCRDGQGGLIGSYRTDDPQLTNLYNIDPYTGSTTLLHSYGATEIYSVFEGLAYAQGDLYGILPGDTLYKINLATYELTEVGNIPAGTWLALVTVPEPGIVVMMLGGVAAFAFRRRREKA